MARSIVVTGGFGVLGQAVAEAFVAAGDKVSRIDFVAAAHTALPGALDIGGVDLTDAAASQAALDKVAAAHGGLDVLVNVAGGFTWETLEGGSIDSWARMQSMNLISNATITRIALPLLQKSGAGRIVNTGLLAPLRFGVVSSKYDGLLMTTYPIRVFGDPVLKRPTSEVTEVNGKFVKLVNSMLDTMYDAPGVGLAAPQVGVEQRFFVYDIGDGPEVLINPNVVATEGEWLYEEGCLSIPGLAFEIVRPKLVTVQATDLDGNEIVIEGDELLGRCFLHEIDHLDGVLMFDRMERDARKQAMREWRERATPIADARHAL